MFKLTLTKITCIVFTSCIATSIASPAQTFTTLRSFIYPYNPAVMGSLIQGTDGNFYGTTLSGGVMDEGTVFKITAGGT